MTARAEIGGQLPVVVDLAVEHDPDGAIFVADRLVARLQVDDAQAAHPQTRTGPQIKALVVRTTVHQGRAHGAQLIERHRLSVEAHDPRDAAHLPGPRFFSTEPSPDVSSAAR